MTVTGSGAARSEIAREAFAARLRAVRARSGKTLRELQGATYASDSALSRYLSGRAVPPWNVVAALCDQAGVDAGELRVQWQAARSIRRRKQTVTQPMLELSAVEDCLTRITDDVSAAIQQVRSRGEQVPEQLLTAVRCGADATLRLQTVRRLISTS
jgi:transcriptional regulator with XRE-family HTH domain